MKKNATRKKFFLTLAMAVLTFCLYSVSAFAMGTDVKVTTAAVNLRTGPGTAYSKIATVPAGVQLYIEQDLGAWLFVDYNTQGGTLQGYVSSQYVGNYGATAQPVQTSNTYGNFTASNDVNLRAGPGTGYAKILVIPGGASLYVNSTSNGWANVTYAGCNGYVSTSYINGLGGSAGTASNKYQNIAYNGSVVLTQKDFTNLYSDASTGSTVVMQLCSGSRLTVLGRSNGWYNVSYNGYNGWIPGTALCKDLGGGYLTT